MHRTQRGFTLLEMMVVIAIMLILMAIATPSLMRAIRTYQLESSGQQIAGMILRARYEAMQRNRRVCAAYVLLGGGDSRYGLDLTTTDPDNDPCNDAAPSPDPGEPYFLVPSIVQWYPTGPPPAWFLNGLPPGYNTAATTDIPANYRVTFSPRGTVETWNGTRWVLATQVQMVCIFRLVPELDAILVTVSPVGRIKLYRWRPNAAGWAEM